MSTARGLRLLVNEKKDEMQRRKKAGKWKQVPGKGRGMKGPKMCRCPLGGASDCLLVTQKKHEVLTAQCFTAMQYIEEWPNHHCVTLCYSLSCTAAVDFLWGSLGL